MLTFGFIADNIIEIPKGMTHDEFHSKFKKTLFNYFFDIVEQGCTKFYTSYQDIYTCYAVKILKHISEIADIDIDINILYTNQAEHDQAMENEVSNEFDYRKYTNAIIFSEYDDETANISNPNFLEPTRDIQKFNTLMNIVEECSSIIFYNSDVIIEKNSFVSTALNYCQNYAIDHINLYGKVL